VNTSTHDCLTPCSIKEIFDLPNITSAAGFNLLTDLADNLGINRALEKLSIGKEDWAKYSAGLEAQLLILAYSLGFQRIEHMEILKDDPLLLEKFQLASLPHKSNLYRLLERFDSQDKIDELSKVNSIPVKFLVNKDRPLVLDMDSTVNTVYGVQENSTVGYNPRYPGRRSYQPLIAFDGDSQAVLNCKQRNGMTCSSTEVIDFYLQSKRRLPQGVKLGYVRADKGFSGQELLEQLDKDGIYYAIKLRKTKEIERRLSRGVLWKRIYADYSTAIEVGSINVRLSTWNKHRRVVVIRSTEYADSGQLRLFDLWDYQFIVTNLDWPPLDIWQFYNRRATCENTIKELKYGVNINCITKNEFYGNFADLWLKIIAYNLLLVLKMNGPKESQNWSIPKLQRLLLNIPAMLIKHARQLKLRLPSWWPYRHIWQNLRLPIPVLQ